MSEFFDELRAQLIEAARARRDRQQTDHAASERTPVDRQVAPRQRPRRRRPGLLVLIAVALIATGTALAAVSIGGQRSQPLSGIVPGGQQPHTALVAGTRYVVGFAPSIQAGQIGWCVSTRTFSSHGDIQDGGTGGCNTPAATRGEPVMGTHTIVNGGGLSYVFTTSKVAAVRIADGPTVLTAPSRRLPANYRAAVFQYTPPRGLLGLFHVPGDGPLVTALSASGKTITQDSSGPPVEPTRSWLYPDAPVTGSCSLAPKPETALRAGSGSVLTSVIAAPTIVGSAFLPCVTRDLYLPRNSARPDASAGLGTYLAGAILLDAARPGAPPGPLPDLQAVPATTGVYDSPTADVFAGNSNKGLTAKRIAGGWLVVAGGATRAQRITALDDLAPEIDLAHQPSSQPTPNGSLCQITYRPIAGVQQTTTSAITTTRRLAPQLSADQARTQQKLTAAQNKLRHEMQANPRSRAVIAADQATVSLLQQATFEAAQEGNGLFWPSCAQSTFYDAQHWPMTATLILATKDCPGRRLPVACAQKAGRQGAQLTRYITRVPGQPDEFSIPTAAFFHPAETVKQIGKSWLVIDGGANLPQRQKLIDQLQTAVSPNLSHALHDTLASPATFCARMDPSAC